MFGSGRPRTSRAIPASRRSHTPSTRRCSLATSTRCCGAARGQRGQAPSGIPSGIGIIQFGARSSAASAARAMTRPVVSAAAPRECEVPLPGADERTRVMVADVSAGLARPQKELPPKYFYDARGSALFEEITRLPEYYLTRAERALLLRSARPLVGELRPRTLVELGAGSAAKTRILLDAMRATGCGEV